MKILSMKPGHDGSIVLVDADSERLEWSYEAEKDGFPRFAEVHPSQILSAFERLEQMPDVFALSGWSKGSVATNEPIGAGYFGHEVSATQLRVARIFGKSMLNFSSTHERSHIWCSYGLSPFEQGRPCYVLIWEGMLGNFYFVDQHLTVSSLGRVMASPGHKYSFLYALADPSFDLPRGRLRRADAGKLMALCAYGTPGPLAPPERELVSFLLDRDDILGSLTKDDMRWSPYHNIGVQHPSFVQLARRYSDQLFDRFYQHAKENLTAGHPLLIGGGCGLNCDWNTLWRDSGLFADVFVPPCTNDVGSAIGTAVDAMRELRGVAKLQWDVYSDRSFYDDHPEMHDIDVSLLSFDRVAHFLSQNNILAWVQGNCEIGPWALGNRSILAAPFTQGMRDRLNSIKGRESFRPVAPICMEEDVAVHFDWCGPSPHMLYFQRVRNRELRAVTHVDGTARVQTVNEVQNPAMHKLLNEFRKLTGAGVLCNTSLNFSSSGFINRTSDLYRFCKRAGIPGFVHGNQFCVFRNGIT